MLTEDKATEFVKSRYNRFATLYDVIEGRLERSRQNRWRELLWSKVTGDRILEVGVGTGRNFPYYPLGAEMTAVDLSEGMLKRARDKASTQQVNVHLEAMDVQNLDFDDNTFDSVVASFVFCTVPDPLRGLTEIRRVCKAGGQVVLMEHVMSEGRIAGFFMNLLNPLALRLIGDNTNRRTVDDVARSGLVVERVTDLGGTVFKLIEARKKQPS